MLEKPLCVATILQRFLSLLNVVFQDHDLNPFTKIPHTPQYKKILETRRKLPVFAQMDEFLEMVCLTVILDMRRAFEFCYSRNQPPSSSQTSRLSFISTKGHRSMLTNLNPVQ
jgi:hypothetical protein